MGCRARPDGDLHFHRVSACGIASASHRWSRPATALLRTSHHVIRNKATFFGFLQADDFELEAGGEFWRAALIIPKLICDIFRFPVTWPKVAADTELLWIGLEVLLKSCSLGVSEWREKLIEDRQAHTDAMTEGRRTTALDTDRVLLGPLHAFLAVHGPGLRVALPR